MSRTPGQLFRFTVVLQLLLLLLVGCSKSKGNPTSPDERQPEDVDPRIVEAQDSGTDEPIVLLWDAYDPNSLGPMRVEVFLKGLGPDYHIRLTEVFPEIAWNLDSDLFPYPPFRIQIFQPYPFPQTSEEQAFFRLISAAMPAGADNYTYDYVTVPINGPVTPAGEKIPVFSWALFRQPEGQPQGRLYRSFPYPGPFTVGMIDTAALRETYRTGTSYGTLPEGPTVNNLAPCEVPCLTQSFTEETSGPKPVNIVWLHGTDPGGDGYGWVDGFFGGSHASENTRNYSDFMGLPGERSPLVHRLVNEDNLDSCQSQDIKEWYFFYNTLQDGVFGLDSAAEALAADVWEKIYQDGSNPNARVIFIGYSQGGLQALHAYKILFSRHANVLGRDPVDRIVTVDGNNRGTAFINFGYDLQNVGDETLNGGGPIENQRNLLWAYFVWLKDVIPRDPKGVGDWLPDPEGDLLWPSFKDHMMGPGVLDQRSPYRYDISLDWADPIGMTPWSALPYWYYKGLLTHGEALDGRNDGDDGNTLTIGGCIGSTGMDRHDDMDMLWEWLKSPMPQKGFPENTLMIGGKAEEWGENIYLERSPVRWPLIGTHYLLGHVLRIRDKNNAILIDLTGSGNAPTNPVVYGAPNEYGRRSVYGDGLIELHSQYGLDLTEWNESSPPTPEPGGRFGDHPHDHYEIMNTSDMPLNPGLGAPNVTAAMAAFVRSVVTANLGPPCDERCPRVGPALGSEPGEILFDQRPSQGESEYDTARIIQSQDPLEYQDVLVHFENELGDAPHPALIEHRPWSTDLTYVYDEVQAARMNSGTATQDGIQIIQAANDRDVYLFTATYPSEAGIQVMRNDTPDHLHPVAWDEPYVIPFANGALHAGNTIATVIDSRLQLFFMGAAECDPECGTQGLYVVRSTNPTPLGPQDWEPEEFIGPINPHMGHFSVADHSGQPVIAYKLERGAPGPLGWQTFTDIWTTFRLPSGAWPLSLVTSFDPREEMQINPIEYSWKQGKFLPVVASAGGVTDVIFTVQYVWEMCMHGDPPEDPECFCPPPGPPADVPTGVGDRFRKEGYVERWSGQSTGTIPPFAWAQGYFTPPSETLIECTNPNGFRVISPTVDMTYKGGRYVAAWLEVQALHPDIGFWEDLGRFEFAASCANVPLSWAQTSKEIDLEPFGWDPPSVGNNINPTMKWVDASSIDNTMFYVFHRVDDEVIGPYTLLAGDLVF